MTKKELEDKLKNIPKDKYIYQRYDGRIYKFLVGDHYILDVNTGMNVAESILLGKTSENIIDLIEEDDIVEVLDNGNGCKAKIHIYDNSFLQAVKEDIQDKNYELIGIASHELFESIKYEV